MVIFLLSSLRATTISISKNYIYFFVDHPANEGEKVNGTVCFEIDIDDCFWSQSIEIVNCGEYFVAIVVDLLRS